MFNSASVVLLCMASAIQGLNLETAMETPCFNISNNPAPLFNMEWAISLGTVYYPIMNNIDLYRAATDLLQKQPNEINTGSIYYDSCLTWHMFKDGTLLSKGFDGLTREYKSRPMEGNPDGYVFWPSDGTDVYSGSAYTTMTDNKTFFFSALCLKNGGMAWGVGSATPTLSEETKKKILEHAESLGFKKEHFTELRYDNCKISA